MLAKYLMVACLLLAVAACAEAPDNVQGNWEGTFTGGKLEGSPVRAEIVADKRGYRANLYIGEWPGGEQAARSMPSEAKRGKIVFSGDARLEPEMGGECKVQMNLADSEIKGNFKGKAAPGRFVMTRVEKKSPTLGQEPPDGAIVLFDGANLDAWQPTERPWKIMPDGAVEVGKGSLRTKDELGGGLYHVEFRTPYMPDKKGQARGNSGVFVLGRYEIQVLDSFGLEGRDNECGGIYKLATPRVNACLPPGEWQTYDIEVRPAEFDGQGRKTKNTIITVRHNGVLIHDNVELGKVTGGAVSDNEAREGILFLQDHGNKVQYRNIWYKPQ